MPTTKAGEKITWKEFFKRWKKGIEGITPLQQTKASIQGTYISLLGVVLGIIASSFSFRTMYWLIIILVGAFVITLMQLIGLKQKCKILEQMENFSIDDFTKEVQDEQESTA